MGRGVNSIRFDSIGSLCSVRVADNSAEQQRRTCRRRVSTVACSALAVPIIASSRPDFSRCYVNGQR